MIVVLSCAREREGAGSLSPSPHGYARGFSINYYKDYRILHVRDPWQGSEGVEFSYVLARKGVDLPDSLSGLPVIRIPVRRIICMSTTHIAMVRALGRQETIVGVSGLDYVSDTIMRQRIAKGIMGDVGAVQAINYELILSLRPDVLMAYGITGEVSGIVSRLRELGIPVMLNGDYLENHPLGKLEWIRFMAALYSDDQKADSIFTEAEHAYLAIRDSVSSAGTRPFVMTGLPWKGSWYIPGGSSYAAAFIRDAGGNFLWEDAPQHEALPLGLEAVYSKAASADIWINCGAARSYKEIINTDVRLGKFNPMITGQVFNNTARLNPYGGNDIWETGVLEPHIILADLVSIFHPGMLPGHELVYYEKLK